MGKTTWMLPICVLLCFSMSEGATCQCNNYNGLCYEPYVSGVLCQNKLNECWDRCEITYIDPMSAYPRNNPTMECCAAAKDPQSVQECYNKLLYSNPHVVSTPPNGHPYTSCYVQGYVAPVPWDTYQNKKCSFDNCFGASGIDCEGLPLVAQAIPRADPIWMTFFEVKILLEAVGFWDFNPSHPVYNADNTVTVDVGVGSILHDSCCMDNAHGAFCSPGNTVVGQIFGDDYNGCACVPEIRHAILDMIWAREWRDTFSYAPESSDMTPVSDHRHSWMPKTMVSWQPDTNGGLPYWDNWGHTPRQSSASLCAPDGTVLSCPAEDPNCRVHGNSYEPCWGRCRATAAHFGAAKHRHRWNQNKLNHAHAGDSDYCCSGQFVEVGWVGSVYWSHEVFGLPPIYSFGLLGKMRYGICGGNRPLEFVGGHGSWGAAGQGDVLMTGGGGGAGEPEEAEEPAEPVCFTRDTYEGSGINTEVGLKEYREDPNSGEDPAEGEEDEVDVVWCPPAEAKGFQYGCEFPSPGCGQEE